MKQEHESSIRVGFAPGGPASTTTRISGSMNYALPRFGLVAVLTLGARFVGAFTAAPCNGGLSGRNRDDGFRECGGLDPARRSSGAARFARAVKRSLRNPEFRTLFLLAGATLTGGTIFYSEKDC